MKRTAIYIDGKRVNRKGLKIKGLNSQINHLRNLCFLNDMSVSQNFKLSTGNKLKIVVSNKSKKK